MIKTIHFIFIFTSLFSFIGRFSLSVFNAHLLQNKFIKIVPHVIDSFLIISGITLIIQGNWLAGEFGWIISKFIILLGYITFGVFAMRSKGIKRWLAFLASIICFVFIFIVAITKNSFI